MSIDDALQPIRIVERTGTRSRVRRVRADPAAGGDALLRPAEPPSGRAAPGEGIAPGQVLGERVQPEIVDDDRPRHGDDAGSEAGGPREHVLAPLVGKPAVEQEVHSARGGGAHDGDEAPARRLGGLAGKALTTAERRAMRTLREQGAMEAEDLAEAAGVQKGTAASVILRRYGQAVPLDPDRHGFVDPAPSAEDELIRVEDERRVQRALARIPERERQVLVSIAEGRGRRERRPGVPRFCRP
jgi:hypothetical protein